MKQKLHVRVPFIGSDSSDARLVTVVSTQDSVVWPGLNGTDSALSATVYFRSVGFRHHAHVLSSVNAFVTSHRCAFAAARYAFVTSTGDADDGGRSGELHPVISASPAVTTMVVARVRVRSGERPGSLLVRTCTPHTAADGPTVRRSRQAKRTTSHQRNEYHHSRAAHFSPTQPLAYFTGYRQVGLVRRSGCIASPLERATTPEGDRT
ncbi:hypothetical protein ITJ53_04185 [Curtobacterium sp. VKM Ac-1796]|uniref:hypothetical protein n=1 Tax=Curtobacterium sp. VKM Ac-1796 TaxID=2783816 RepID=UPI00188C01E3|nr:hypothetical protein [Curtobacterium sp. VKM Ac-1796]MBF4596646.1 hypothetical protein [Curtobacterium sp. VKM Ac-1796]